LHLLACRGGDGANVAIGHLWWGEAPERPNDITSALG